MSKIEIYSIDGVKTGKTVDLPESILVPKKMNRHIIFEVVNMEHQNSRQGTHETKSKAEVSGTGKKPYKQKHTGRARQGSRRNPHFRGGGSAFGPTSEANHSVRVNKKVSKIALISAWSKVVESNNVAILDESFDEIGKSSKRFFKFLETSGLVDKKILCIFEPEDSGLLYSTRNIQNIIQRTSDYCSVRDLLNQNYLLISQKSWPKLVDRLSKWS